jgi:TonB family protein
VTLRGFPAGSRLHYDASGDPRDSFTPGIWTLDGRVRIDRVRLASTTLRIDASRLGVVYDPDAGAFSHVLTSGRRVRLDVAVGAAAGEQLVEAALERVLLTSGDDLADVVPEHWQRFLRGYQSPLGPPWREEALTLDEPQRAVPEPRRVRFVRPEYPAVALQFRRTGAVAFEAVLTTEGTIQELHLIQPAGFGFDEAAAAAIRQWAFEPVVVDDTRVPVIMKLSAEFLLR